MTEKKSVENEDSLDILWDIDETSFNQTFDMDSNKDPVLGIELTPPEETIDPLEPKKDEVKEMLEEDLDIDDKVKEETKNEEPQDVPELDLDKPLESQETSEDGEDPITVFAKMLEENEILTVGEDFDPSEEGLVKAFETTVEGRVQEEIDLFQSSLPDEGRALLKHLMNGGEVSNFVQAYSEPDISKLDINGEDNTRNQKYVLKEFMRLRGDSDQDIEETLDLYEDNDILDKQAKKAKARLAQYQDHKRKEMELQQKSKAEAKEKQREEIVETIEKTVTDSSDISGFPISKKHKRDLLQYMTATNVKIDTAEGVQYVTQFQADEMKASQNVDDFILRAYLRMTDFDVSSAKQKAVTDYSSKLKKSLQNRKGMTDTKATFGGNKRPISKKSSTDWEI